MAPYKLVYFNARGRAEPIRLIFAYAGQQYEDVRLDGADWGGYKSRTPFGQMPVLEVDDTMIAQSKSIARYLGREFKLTPSNQFDAARLDMLVDGLDDVFNHFRPFHMEKDPEKKKELWAALEKDHIAPFLHRYEKFLIEGGKTFFVSDHITWGDIVIFDRLYTLRMRAPEIFDKHDVLCKFVNHIAEMPAINNWIEARPKTEM